MTNCLSTIDNGGLGGFLRRRLDMEGNFRSKFRPNFRFLKEKNYFEIRKLKTCGLYYKCFTIVIYDRNDSGQFYKTRIMNVIDDPS